MVLTHYLGEAVRTLERVQQGKPAAYFPATERILFAEHYQGPYRPKDDGDEAKGQGTETACDGPADFLLS